MDESTEETRERQAAAISGEIDQEVGENGVLVSGGGADARVLRSQEAPDAGAFRTPVAGGARRGSRSGGQAGRGPRSLLEELHSTERRDSPHIQALKREVQACKVDLNEAMDSTEVAFTLAAGRLSAAKARLEASEAAAAAASEPSAAERGEAETRAAFGDIQRT